MTHNITPSLIFSNGTHVAPRNHFRFSGVNRLTYARGSSRSSVVAVRFNCFCRSSISCRAFAGWGFRSWRRYHMSSHPTSISQRRRSASDLGWSSLTASAKQSRWSWSMSITRTPTGPSEYRLRWSGVHVLRPRPLGEHPRLRGQGVFAPCGRAGCNWR